MNINGKVNESGPSYLNMKSPWYDQVIKQDFDGQDETETKEIVNILNSAKVVRFSPRQVVYREGDAVDAVFVLRSGLVKLLNYLPNGRARIVRLHGKNAWIGMSGVLRKPQENTAVAIGGVEAYRIPVQELRRLKTEDTLQYCMLLERGFEYLREADVWIAQFATGSIKSRVARLINYLSEIENDEESERVRLLTCEEMGAILGVTPESVSRTVADFKRKKMLRSVTRFSRECYDRNIQALEAIALDK